MKYDDASWHYGGDFPSDLPNEAAATHIGMFLAWAFKKGLGGHIHTDEVPGELEELFNRRVTPGAFLLDVGDGKFADEDLNEEGNEFAEAYFNLSNGLYLSDYETELAANCPTTYHIADTWDNYDRIAPVIDRRYDEWKRGTLKSAEPTEKATEALENKPWWKIW